MRVVESIQNIGSKDLSVHGSLLIYCSKKGCHRVFVEYLHTDCVHGFGLTKQNDNF